MGDGYALLVAQGVRAFLDDLDEKFERIVRENLQHLTKPYPGRGQGDKEKIEWRSAERSEADLVGRAERV